MIKIPQATHKKNIFNLPAHFYSLAIYSTKRVPNRSTIAQTTGRAKQALKRVSDVRLRWDEVKQVKVTRRPRPPIHKPSDRSDYSI